MTEKLPKSKYDALAEAAERPGGWGLFKAKSTEWLAGRGFFVKDKHPAYGMQWRITDAGREEYEKQRQLRFESMTEEM